MEGQNKKRHITEKINQTGNIHITKIHPCILYQHSPHNLPNSYKTAVIQSYRYNKIIYAKRKRSVPNMAINNFLVSSTRCARRSSNTKHLLPSWQPYQRCIFLFIILHTL